MEGDAATLTMRKIDRGLGRSQSRIIPCSTWLQVNLRFAVGLAGGRAHLMVDGELGTSFGERNRHHQPYVGEQD